MLPALLHPAHLRAARGSPQERSHLLISIMYAEVGALVGGARKAHHEGQSLGFVYDYCVCIVKVAKQQYPESQRTKV